MKRSSYVLDSPLDSIEKVGERGMLAKLMSVMDNNIQPLHETVEALRRSYSSKSLQPHCRTERYRRSFIPQQSSCIIHTQDTTIIMLIVFLTYL